MSYTPPTVRSTGDLITASIYNTDIINNLIAIFSGALGLTAQAVGDIMYAASASQLARLAMGVSSGMPLASVAAGVPVWGGDMDWLGSLLKNAELKGFIRTKQAVTISGGTLTLDYKAGQLVTFPFNADITTMVFNNLPASGKGAAFELVPTQSGAAHAWAWLTGTAKWANSAAPALAGWTDTKRARLVIETEDGGTTWDGTLIGENIL